MSNLEFGKILVFVNALVPLFLLVFDGINGNLGANPTEFFLRTTGVLALVFLMLTLAVTPLRKMFAWNELIKYRRMLGLYVFFYTFLHLTTYALFDKSLDFSAIAADAAQRPFIAVGFTGFLMLVPLAVTSTAKMIKKLGGKNWAKLHKLTYAAAIAGVLHFWMAVKSDLRYPIFFAFILLLLLGYRLLNTNSRKPIIAQKQKA